MLRAMVPMHWSTSTDSTMFVFDTVSIAFLTYLFSVALWKYFDAAILSTSCRIFFLVVPEPDGFLH